MTKFVVMLAVLGMFFILVYGLISCEPGVQDVSPNLTTRTPTAAKTADTKPIPTSTPAPNYAATQAALDLAIANHQRDIAEQMSRATGTAEALAIEHQAEIYAIEIDAAKVNLSSAIEAAEYQRDLHQQVISKTVKLSESEVRSAERLATGKANITFVWLGGLAFLSLLVITLFIAAAIKLYIDRGRAENNATLEEQQRALDAEQARLNAERAAALKAARLTMIQNFIYDAIRVNGPDDHQIPANTKMDDWHADRWQQVVDLLKADGMAYTTNRGTWLKAGTLGELRHALENNEYPYPTSRADAARKRYQERMQTDQNGKEYGDE